MPVLRRKPKRNVSTRYWYAATFTASGDHLGVLEPRRGGRVVVVCLDTLAEITNAHDRSMRLYAKAGDRLHLHGPTPNDIAAATVAHVETRDWNDLLTVQITCGRIEAGEVQCMRMARRL